MFEFPSHFSWRAAASGSDRYYRHGDHTSFLTTSPTSLNAFNSGEASSFKKLAQGQV